jgi:hypothetical protein
VYQGIHCSSIKYNVKPEREDKIMKRTALHILSVILLITPVAAPASGSIPNANLRVTVQQKKTEKLTRASMFLNFSARTAIVLFPPYRLISAENLVQANRHFIPRFNIHPHRSVI